MNFCHTFISETFKSRSIKIKLFETVLNCSSKISSSLCWFSITFRSWDLEKFKQKFWTIILGFSSWEHDEFYCSDRRFTILVRASCNSNGLTPPCKARLLRALIFSLFFKRLQESDSQLAQYQKHFRKKRVSFFCFKLIIKDMNFDSSNFYSVTRYD